MAWRARAGGSGRRSRSAPLREPPEPRKSPGPQEPREPPEPASAAAEARRAFAAALRALARRPRTEAELRALLERRAYPPAAVASALARLRDSNLVDEGAVADAVLREAERRGLGSQRVARTLVRRGLAPALLDGARRASASGEVERARHALARRWPGGIGPDARQLARAVRFLQSRGFPGAAVREALGRDVSVDEPELDPDREAG